MEMTEEVIEVAAEGEGITIRNRVTLQVTTLRYASDARM